MRERRGGEERVGGGGGGHIKPYPAGGLLHAGRRQKKHEYTPAGEPHCVPLSPDGRRWPAEAQLTSSSAHARAGFHRRGIQLKGAACCLPHLVWVLLHLGLLPVHKVALVQHRRPRHPAPRTHRVFRIEGRLANCLLWHSMPSMPVWPLIITRQPAPAGALPAWMYITA